jgi:hypothetical protein
LLCSKSELPLLPSPPPQWWLLERERPVSGEVGRRLEAGGRTGEGRLVVEEEEMERKVVVVCAVVGFLGVLSAALGFAAEGTRVKVSVPILPSPP